jgi:hypothetical protein
MLTLLYLENCSCEVDFILNDVLFDIDLQVEFFKHDDFVSFKNREELFEKNILVINRVIKLEDIVNVVKIIKPIVIFYLSDEDGREAKTTVLEKYTKLLFRQNNYNHYNYSKNNYHIALGYCKPYLKNKNSFNLNIKKVKDREFYSSFVGAEKTNRTNMKNVFEQNMKNTKIILHFKTS